MSEYVLDSSAIIAVIIDEPGGDRVRSVLENSVMCSVNLAEVVTKLIDREIPFAIIEATIDDLNLPIEPFTMTDAIAAGKLRAATRSAGLSLGDRACLALAERLGAIALTADTAWARSDLPVAVELIR